MRTAKTAAVAAAIAGFALAACGGSYASSTTSRPAEPGFYIRIAGMAFSPLDLRVPPGATVTVLNDDGTAHSVTSEASPGAFTPGSAGGVSFDTGPFTGGSRSFGIPPDAAEGTVIPYYCSTHLGTMATPNGSVTIDASATPSPPPGAPGGSGGGYATGH